MRTILLALSVLALSWPANAGAVSDARVQAAASKSIPHAVEAYKWFHAHPELSGAERETASRLAGELRKLGLEVHENIGGHGIVAVLRSRSGAKNAPVVLYRADMDGLPVTEATGLGYASKNKGVMHACGHDVHMATAVGVLSTLKALDDHWQGTVVFVGQPAEETGSGARAMLADAKFRRILKKTGKPRLAVALHDAADLPAGVVSLTPGFEHANVDSVDIVVAGKGGHGARPNETIDPIVIGSEIVMALQTIVSRRLNPREPAVVTVGKFAAGTKHNIIPPTATLLLTVRSYGDQTRATLLREIKRTARHVARAHGAPYPAVTVRKGFVPAAYNDPKWTKRLTARFRSLLGTSSVETHPPSLGGEDFGLFARELKIPGVMWKLGAVNPRKYKRSKGKGLPSLHSDLFAADPEPTIDTGIQTGVAAVLAGLDD